MKHFKFLDIVFKYRLRSIGFAVSASQHVRRSGAFGVALAASAAVMAQGLGIVDSTDPLGPGYVYRASRMLSTGNPLGAKDQTAASAGDFRFLTPDQQARWLAAEGGALFERGDYACVDVLTRLASEYPASPEA
ncbi:MAG: hypothetical protein K2F93_01955, partial [Muribaculaceae bacterium]|nr:hypothetical protein [Muribaculaceae bacterium]